MVFIPCRITEGLRPSEVVAVFSDSNSRNHYLRVEREFLSRNGDSYLLPVGLVHQDVDKRVALIELSHEAETGVNRIWVASDALRSNPGNPA